MPGQFHFAGGRRERPLHVPLAGPHRVGDVARHTACNLFAVRRQCSSHTYDKSRTPGQRLGGAQHWRLRSTDCNSASPMPCRLFAATSNFWHRMFPRGQTKRKFDKPILLG